jgi:hypothetical protein
MPKSGYYGDQTGKPSQYKIAMDAVKKRKRMKERAKRMDICGATTHSGGICRKSAGWGTNHQGIGKCRIHGGTAPSHIKHAARVAANELLGTPMEINPFDAILWCIKIRAGEVQWLSERMAELDKEAWVEKTLTGKQFHLYARARSAAMVDLAKFSAMAVSLGIAERAIKLAETYGELLAQYTKNLLNDLWPHLDEEGRVKAPQYVRLRLVQLDQGREMPELPAGAREADASSKRSKAG